ncbi:xanthine dehydrogenase family protein subunit M, partial [Mesorhizobium sp. M2C.T.Ca.TU.002.02.1.1]
MYSVNYHRASSVADAAKLLKNGDAKLLSGGMTLIPAMKTRLASPSDLVDVSRLKDLQGVKVSGKTVTIGAATTHYDVSTDEKLRKACPALAHMASLIGDPAVRHRGTIGGSIANNDPAADYPAALLALGATIITNKREIAADKFFKGLFETALKEGEIITAVSFTAPAKAAYQKFRNPASRYAIVGVFVTKGKDGVRAAVTGAGEDGVFRSKEIEAALAKNFDAAALGGLKVPAKGLM